MSEQSYCKCCNSHYGIGGVSAGLCSRCAEHNAELRKQLEDSERTLLKTLNELMDVEMENKQLREQLKEAGKDSEPLPALVLMFGQGNILTQLYKTDNNELGILLWDSGKKHTVGECYPEEWVDLRKPQPGMVYLHFPDSASLEVVLDQLSRLQSGEWEAIDAALEREKRDE